MKAPANAYTCTCCAPPIQGLFQRGSARERRKLHLLRAEPCPPSPISGTAPDLILVGGTVRTMNPHQPVAEAIAIKGGRIVSVGRRAEITALKGTGTEIIDAKGGTILPGFIDPHVHVVMGAMLNSFVNVRALTCATIDDVMAKLNAAASRAAPGAWVMAQGFDPSLTKGNADINRHDLDRVAPDNPLFMINASGHLAYVNSKAIELAGVNEKTPDPGAGGKYMKGADGKLTGVLAGGSSYAPFLRVAPRATPQSLTTACAEVLDDAARKGCTMLVDAGLGAFAGTAEYGILKALTTARRSPVRLAAMMSSVHMDSWLSMPDVKLGNGDDWLRLLGFKFWSDGSNQGNTGFQRERYLNLDSKGIPSFPPEALTAGIKRAHDAGWQVAVHANGDAAIDMVLAAYEVVLKAKPRGDHRHRIEHCSIAWDEHFAKMAELGLTPSFLIGHVHYWGRAFRDRIFGPQKAARLDATASAGRAGVRYTLHSDFDVTEIGPLRCIENAVTRVMRDGGDILAPDERIPVEQALRTMTIDAAWQARMDHAVGTLEAGKYADLVVLDEDPMEVNPMRLSQIGVRETWVEGQRRYG
jgi:predicted amidohydrolase YtcJ